MKSHIPPPRELDADERIMLEIGVVKNIRGASSMATVRRLHRLGLGEFDEEARVFTANERGRAAVSP